MNNVTGEDGGRMETGTPAVTSTRAAVAQRGKKIDGMLPGPVLFCKPLYLDIPPKNSAFIPIQGQYSGVTFTTRVLLFLRCSLLLISLP